MRVLVIRFSSLGDVVLATSAVEALQAERPDVEVDVLTKPAFREIFANHPGVRGTVEWDPGTGLGRLARHIRAGRYDWIVDLHGNLRTAVLRALTPGLRWSGYRKGATRRRLALWRRRPELLPADHVVDRYIAALRPLGVPATRRLPTVYPGRGERDRARDLLREAGWDGEASLVALAPGARWRTKAWPAHRWGELVRLLAGRALPVVVGGPEDSELGGAILGGTRGANLAGRTSLLETAASLELCSALVTNDSAPLHLSTAVRTPAVALFGPTVGGFGFHPLGEGDTLLERDLPCRPCSLHGDPACPLVHHECLSSIPAEEVWAAVRRVLDQGGEESDP